jgi:hypothetical protein
MKREERFPEGEPMTDADRMHKILNMALLKRKHTAFAAIMAGTPGLGVSIFPCVLGGLLL